MAGIILDNGPGTPPDPESDFDAERWRHTGLRVRMLSGLWEEDLHDAIAQHVESSRAEAWGVPDLSSNVFRSVSGQLAALYDSRPTVGHTGGAEDLIGPGGLIDRAGLWPMMPRVQMNTIGLREMVVRVDYTARGGLQYRPVTPDRVVAWSVPDAPGVMAGYRELRIRTVEGKDLWAWDEYDVTDPDAPSFRIVKAAQEGKAEEDITQLVTGETFQGDGYTWRRSDGSPVIPAVLYHAEKIGDGLWDSWHGCEVVFGSLKASVLWTFFGHAVLDASWPQRYAANAQVRGLDVQDAGSRGMRQSLPMDPASLLLLDVAEEGQGQPLIGQFEPGADISKLFTAIEQYEARVSEFANISPADIQRLSGSARSGYAIAISNEGKRNAQRRLEPQFRAGDLELVELSAIAINRATGSAFPEDDYSISYGSVPLSAQEREALRKDHVEKIAAGLMSPVDAYMELHPGVSRDKAIEDLQRIQRERALGPTIT